MEKARERLNGGSSKIKQGKKKRGWPKLYVGDMVRGQDPKTKEWSLKGEGLELVYGQRSVDVGLKDGRSRLFTREKVKKDSTKRYQEVGEEELRNQVAGTSLEAEEDEELEEFMQERRKRQSPNTEQVEPRRSTSLAKKRVSMGPQGTVDDPDILAYYMEAVKQGWASTKKRCSSTAWRRASIPVGRSGPGRPSATKRAAGAGE